MTENLITRSELARRAGVYPSAITQACDSELAAAVSGKHIDADHPLVIAYIERKQSPTAAQPVTGIDARYQEAVDWCVDNNRYSISGLQAALGIGYGRAKKIIDTMEAAKLIPQAVLDKRKPAPRTKKAEAKPSTAAATEEPEHKGAGIAKEKKKGTQATKRGEVPDNMREYNDWPLKKIIKEFGNDLRFVDFLKATKEIELITERRIKNAKEEGDLISRQLVKDHVIATFNEAHIKMLTDGAKTMATRSSAIRDAGGTVADVEKFIKEQLTSFIKPVKNKVARALRSG